MIEVEIPGNGRIRIKTVVLDLNGTVAIEGKVVPGVKESIRELKDKGLKVILFSGDTRGNAAEIAKDLGISLIQTKTAEDKEREIGKLDPGTCVTIGNGLIDCLQMEKAALSVVTLQKEGIHTKALFSADIIIPSIIDALNLLLNSSSLIATLRK